MPIRIAKDGTNILIGDIEEALSLVAECGNDIDVVNMSFTSLDPYPPVERLIAKIAGNGTICVAAAGNWHHYNADGTIDEPSPYEVKYPASYENVISVASVDSGDKVAESSNRNAFVEISAPGVGIFTTANSKASETLGSEYTVVSGTSFSAPQVAAAAALLKAKYPEWGCEQVLTRLRGSARNVTGMDGKDYTYEYGYGVLDAAAALNYGYRPEDGKYGVESKLDGGVDYLIELGDECPEALRPSEYLLEDYYERHPDKRP